MATIGNSTITPTKEYRNVDAAYVLLGNLFQKQVTDTVKLDAVACLSKARNVKRNYISDPSIGVPFVTATTMQRVRPGTGNLIARSELQENDNRMLDKDLILVSCSGSIGKVVHLNASFEGMVGSDDIIRIKANSEVIGSGYLYAFLASRIGQACIDPLAYGTAIRHLSISALGQIDIPVLPKEIQQQINDKVLTAGKYRAEANQSLDQTNTFLLSNLGLPPLTPDDYEIFGQCARERGVASFSAEMDFKKAKTLSALNNSNRICELRKRIESTGEVMPLSALIDDRGVFKTKIFKRATTQSASGLRLINQSDLFDIHKKGKVIRGKKVSNSDLVAYAEILISGVGAISENASLGRVIFAGEELSGSLLSSPIYRIASEQKDFSGYLFAWLNSEYGFRLIRGMGYGSVLTWINKHLLLNLPVPILKESVMKEIDQSVKKAFTLRNEARLLELSAIEQLESEVEKWQN